MKILHVGLGHPPRWMSCGPVVYVHSLALAQRAAGHEVVVACASDEQAPGRPAYDPTVVAVDGLAYVAIRNRPVLEHDLFNPLREVHDADLARAFDHILREVGPEVVHVHNLVGLSLDVLSSAHRYGAIVVMSLHNYFPICSRDDLFFANAEACDGPRTRSCARCLGTLVADEQYRRRSQAFVAALNDCDLLLPVSHRVASLYASQGVRRDRMVVERIGSSAAEALWRAGGEARVARAREGLPESPGSDGDRLRAVFFGAPLARKGLMTFLQALPRLDHPGRVDAHLYGATDPTQAELIGRALASFPAAARSSVTLHGAYTQQDLPGILQHMDIAVITPRWEDNGPQTVMEALAAGLPVVGTRMGGIPDLVVDGRNGVLVAEGDVGHLAATLGRLSSAAEAVRRLRAGISAPRTITEHAGALDDRYDEAGRRARQGAPEAVPALT